MDFILKVDNNVLSLYSEDSCLLIVGGDLEGRRSPKIEVSGRDGPCIRPPNILRSNVIGRAWK